MSASLGFQAMAESDRTAEQDYMKMKAKVLDEMKKAFRPEFLNRIDAVVVFHSLTHADVRSIVELMLKRVADKLIAHKLGLAVNDAVVELLTREGFDKVYGARPLRRVIQRTIEDPLSEEILRGKAGEGTTVTLDVVDDKVIFVMPKDTDKELVGAVKSAGD
jgi:ATP-dependent Clp protease ATP-binding subunit ClpC